jgi:hypothetical protein
VHGSFIADLVIVHRPDVNLLLIPIAVGPEAIEKLRDSGDCCKWDLSGHFDSFRSRQDPAPPHYSAFC